MHFPTDINLLYDAMRVLLHICAQLSEEFELKGWRQFNSGLKKLKKALSACFKSIKNSYELE